ncbi:hypothetical protein ANO11243_057600 [Dothideomycetidae sp. 11243]|nr:hypothetical protein ANO11243_057600 [fungal sp. No.11243]
MPAPCGFEPCDRVVVVVVGPVLWPSVKSGPGRIAGVRRPGSVATAWVEASSTGDEGKVKIPAIASTNLKVSDLVELEKNRDTGNGGDGLECLWRPIARGKSRMTGHREWDGVSCRWLPRWFYNGGAMGPATVPRELGKTDRRRGDRHAAQMSGLVVVLVRPYGPLARISPSVTRITFCWPMLWHGPDRERRVV